MSAVRIIVAWLLIAALPLQGMAAASMLFCGKGGVPTPSAAGHSVHHDSSTHAHSDHDKAIHGHAAGGPQAAADDDGAGQASADDGHSCPICASCCNAVAPAGHSSLSLSSGAPAAVLSQPSARILTRASPRPDKPPRA